MRKQMTMGKENMVWTKQLLQKGNKLVINTQGSKLTKNNKAGGGHKNTEQQTERRSGVK